MLLALHILYLNKCWKWIRKKCSRKTPLWSFWGDRSPPSRLREKLNKFKVPDKVLILCPLELQKLQINKRKKRALSCPEELRRASESHWEKTFRETK